MPADPFAPFPNLSVALYMATYFSGMDTKSEEHACYETSIFISFLDYWQVTLTWSPYGDASLIRSLLIGDMSTIYYPDVAIRVTMTLTNTCSC